MTNYHIAANGEPAVCKAQPGNCPLGGEHFEDMASAATRAVEKRMDKVADGSMKRPLEDKTEPEIDEQLADIYYRASKIRGDLYQATQDLERYTARLEQAQASVEGNPYMARYAEAYQKDITSVTARIEKIREDLAKVEAERGPGEAEYDFRGGWTRAFLARSKPGHVHRSMNCPSCNKGKQSTQFAWLTEYSGKSEDEIVSDAGEHACTYCYPSAPVETLNRPSKIKWQEPETPEAKARREKKEAAAKVKAEKGITNPDGSELLTRNRPNSNAVSQVKTLFSAERDALETMESLEHSKTSQGISGTEEYKALYSENLQVLTAAIGHKLGKTEAETKAYLAEKYEAKKKRDAKNRW
jgi:hypothetical protein